MRTALKLLGLGLTLTATALLAASAALQAELQDPNLAPHWLYDDLPAATAQAKESGKPLLVELRCVPCPAAGPLDAAITHPSAELEAVERQFVCVRVIKNQGLDQRIFQFDLDNSLQVFFMNADGTVYGRYGSRAGNAGKSDTYLTLPSFQRAAERALALHRGYPGNKAQLSGKQAPAPEYRFPELIPGLTDRAVDPVTKKTCIHCHMVRESILTNKWTTRTLRPVDLFCYPLPANVGLTVNIDDGLRVDAVAADSPAAKAGLAAGDELVALNGQPLISIADMQWVLNGLPDDARLTAQVRRAGAVSERTLALSGTWRESDLSWRSTSWGALRHGLLTAALTPEEQQARGIPAGRLALQVKQMYGKAQQVLPKAGLMAKDVIVGLDGQSDAMTESVFLVWLRLNHGPNDSLKLSLLRGDQKMELTVPMW